MALLLLHQCGSFCKMVHSTPPSLMADALQIFDKVLLDLNDPKCSELSWKCTPLAVETYGCWGAEARETLSRIAPRLAIPMRCTKSFHLWPTQSHFGEVLCAVKRWTFVGCHWLTVFNLYSCFLCVNNNNNHCCITKKLNTN